MIPLDDDEHIHLDKDAGKSEKSADAFNRLKSAHNYVFLNNKAHGIFLDIQDDLNKELVSHGYLHGDVLLNITSASRTHAAQVDLAEKDIEKNGKTNATNSLSAHEV
jgi:hypothetical protein